MQTVGPITTDVPSKLRHTSTWVVDTIVVAVVVVVVEINAKAEIHDIRRHLNDKNKIQAKHTHPGKGNSNSF